MNKFKEFVRDALVDCRDRGLTRQQTAEELGVSYGHLSHLIRNNAISWRKETGKAQMHRVERGRNADIVAKFDAGMTLQAIGDDYGITRERVRQIVGKAKREARSLTIARIRQEQCEWLKKQPPRNVRNLAAELGVTGSIIYQLAKKTGYKPLVRDEEDEEKLRELSLLVLGGKSFNEAVEGTDITANRLIYWCNTHGIKSSAPTRWSVSPERADIIRAGRAAGKSWAAISDEVAEHEGVRGFSATALYVWCTKNAPDILDIHPPKTKRAPRRVPWKRRAPVVASSPGAQVEVKETIRETAIANYGKCTASRIAEAVGVSRNVIIGHWNRSRDLIGSRASSTTAAQQGEVA